MNDYYCFCIIKKARIRAFFYLILILFILGVILDQDSDILYL